MEEKIHHMDMENRRIKMREIAEAVGISTEWVHNILLEKLEIKKVYIRWVPTLLTSDQKRNWKDKPKNLRFNADLAKFNRNSQDFFHRFLTVTKPGSTKIHVKQGSIQSSTTW